MNIGELNISRDTKVPYFIAEIGVNHENSMDIAKQMVDMAIEGGAHAVKFQAYKSERLASKFSPAYWDTSEEPTTSQLELFKKFDHWTFSEYAEIAKYCEERGVQFLCTAFDEEAVDRLDQLMPAFKVASADITNFPLLQRISEKGKPVILSVGASELYEIAYAVDFLLTRGVKDLSLLHCVLKYPTPTEDANLKAIKTLSYAFPELVIGYSDHTKPDPGMWTLLQAFQNGARIIEKHFTHDKSLSGNDHYHSLDYRDLKTFFRGIDHLSQVDGTGSIATKESQLAARRNARRGIVANRDIRPGEIIRKEDIAVKRPCHGLEPKDMELIIGRKINVVLEKDDFFKKEHFELS